MERMSDFLLDHSHEFLTSSPVGVWVLDIEPPMPLQLPEREQVEFLLNHAVLRGCNNAFMNHLEADGCTVAVGDTLGRLVADQRIIDVPRLQMCARQAFGRSESSHARCLDSGAIQVFAESLTGIRKDGHLVRIWGTLRDISAFREVETHYAELRERLIEAQSAEASALLMAGVAHDFNNYLLVMLNASELARDEIPSDSPAIELLEMIDSAGLQARDLVEVLLSKNDADEPKTQSLGDAVVTMSKILTALAGTHVPVHVEIEPPDVPVRVPRVHLRQVVLNLVHNSAQALSGRVGDITIRVGRTTPSTEDLEASACGGNLVPGTPCAMLEVEDNGHGMPPDVAAQIFRPFFTTKLTGKGLGLAATLAIVDRYGGCMNVDSEPGRGTRMRVLLPQAD